MTKDEIRKLKSEPVIGKEVTLRLATEQDAEFILELRLNPLLNKFIGKTDPSVEKQRAWIKSAYDKDTDFHFIIEDKNKVRYGTVAVYGIDYNTGVAEWGRWVIKQHTTMFISVESMILTLYFAFRKLGLKKLTGGTYNQNKQVVSFHKKYGSVSSVDETFTWFYFEEQNFLKALRLFKNFHNLQIDPPELIN